MTDPRYARIRAIFHELCETPPGERGERLEAIGREDPALRDEVMQLLESHDRQAFETQPLHGLTPHGAATPRIGGFRVLRLLGEGGMGAVYEAEQERPARRVALKIIRPGFVSEAVVRRFRREAEVLGRLQHPGIAQVYEVGVGDVDGRPTPYLAMELIEGLPLTHHAAEAKLDTRARLELACKLCDAVQHAHERSVVHRDLKPANILVDRSGQPKILDFGVSRITDGDLRLTTMRTEAGQILGTAAYMSPEQASGDPTEVDSRSDIYALGVVIFELLAGRLPHEIGRLPLPDAIRVIREDEPTRIGSVNANLRGDIDTILAKALEREKARRYQSAAELGADIRRHLHDEPILAHRPSTIYQLRKFARRNRALVGGVAAVMIALTVGLVATGLALRREAGARDAAELALARAESSASFLQSVLLGLDPNQTQGRDTELLKDMLDRAAATLDEQSTVPEVRAEMLGIIGRAYNSIFEHQEAAELLTQAVEALGAMGPEQEHERNNLQLQLAHAHRQNGDTAAQAAAYEAVLARLDLRDDPLQRISALRQVAEFRMDQGDWPGALESIEAALSVDAMEEPEDEARTAVMHGAILRRLGRLDEARTSYERALELFRAHAGPIEQTIALNSLAVLARDQGRTDDAERLYREAISLREAADPRPNPQTATMLANLGSLLVSKGQLDEAEPFLQRSVAMHIALFPEGHFSVGIPMSRLARLKSAQGLHGEAIATNEAALKIFRDHLPAQHPIIATGLSDQGQFLDEAGMPVEAEAAYREALAMAEALGLNERIYRGPILRRLARCMASQGRADEARALLEPSLAWYDADDPDAVATRELIAEFASPPADG